MIYICVHVVCTPIDEHAESTIVIDGNIKFVPDRGK